MKIFEICPRKFFESNFLQNAWAEWNFKQKVRIQHTIWRRIPAVILECFLWLEIRFLGPLTKTCRLGSRLLKVFLLLIFVSSQSVLAIKIKPVNQSSDTTKLCWRTHKNLVKRNLLIFPVGFVFSHFHLRENETTESRNFQSRERGNSRASFYFGAIMYPAKDFQLESFCWDNLLVRPDFNYE